MRDGLGVAIVGAGLMGRWHAHYAAQAGARIVAFVDLDSARARALRNRHPSAETFSNLGECLGRTKADVVHVCTRTESHLELTLEALAIGKHVLVEKPVAGSAAETCRVIEAARHAGVRLCAAHQFPFQRGFRRARQGLSRLGDVVSVDFHTCTTGGEGLPEAARREIPLEILPHPLSLFRALGFADSVHKPTVYFSEHFLMIHSVPEGGPSLGLTIDLRGRPTRNELTLIGSKGSALVDLFHGFCKFEPGTTSRASKAARPFWDGTALLVAAGTNLLGRAIRNEPAYPGLGSLIRRFYEAIRTGAPSPVTDDEMIEVALVMDRVREIARASQS